MPNRRGRWSVSGKFTAVGKSAWSRVPQERGQTRGGASAISLRARSSPILSLVSLNVRSDDEQDDRWKCDRPTYEHAEGRHHRPFHASRRSRRRRAGPGPRIRREADRASTRDADTLSTWKTCQPPGAVPPMPPAFQSPSTPSAHPPIPPAIGPPTGHSGYGSAHTPPMKAPT